MDPKTTGKNQFGFGGLGRVLPRAIASSDLTPATIPSENLPALKFGMI